ncbi:MAG: VanZ family protein [Bacteroidales bacterium]|nr:VanZ family protein [Bacteroidales bacterium]
MNSQRLILPNDANGFIVEEMMERLNNGITVTIAFGGSSMLPLIDGRSDRIELSPINGELRLGEIYLFVYNGHCVIHRLLKIRYEKFVFRGDNCCSCEVVTREAVLARLIAVCHSDGSRENCDSLQWRRKSRRVSTLRTLKNLPFRLFGRPQRRWERWLYIALLLILMWAPVGVLGIPLNNFVFGIRFDHLLHASVYVPFVFFLMDFGKVKMSKLIPHWLVGLLFAGVTESVQLLLPYRGFDINDLVANFLGVTLGWIIVSCWKIRRQ